MTAESWTGGDMGSKRADSRVVIISGASRGLGREISRQYCRRGLRVAGLARDTERLASLGAEIAGFPGEFLGLTVDVTDADRVKQAVTGLIDRWGRIDIAIANAGIAGAGWAAKQSPEATAQLIQVNFLGMVNLFGPVIPAMIDRHHGQLAGIASIAGFRGMPRLAAYAASKAAMRSYLETLRIELHSRGIHVSTICPGYIETEMTKAGGRPMPFMMPVDQAAARVIEAIERHQAEVVFPFPMAVLTNVLQFLPNSLYDSVVRWFT